MQEAAVRLLPENYQQRRIRPIGLIFHSIVGSAEAAYGKFLNSSTLESTFIVRKDGGIIQLMDTTVQADANYLANTLYGSVETEDNGHPDIDPWTEPQLQALIKIGLFYHHTHGVPITRVRYHGDPGIGYHTMFGAPGPWTPVAKSCPGRARIAQFDRLLVRMAEGRVDDMPSEAFFQLLHQDEKNQRAELHKDLTERLANIHATLKDVRSNTEA